MPSDWKIGNGIKAEIVKRAGLYLSDWTDGLADAKMKLISTSVFLYFICLLPTIAFGALNESTTFGFFTVQKTIIAQGFGGIIFALCSGQPLVVLLTTAPLALIIQIVQEVSINLDVPFRSLYAWVGIFNTCFLLIFSFSNLSDIFLRRTSPFCEETISIALTIDAAKALHSEFGANYYNDIGRDSSLLWIILMFGTLLLGVWLWGFRKSVLLSASLRVIIVDFAVPAAVVTLSVVGSVGFRDVPLVGFNSHSNFRFEFPDLDIKIGGILLAVPIGFALSLLFFMDQNISAALIHTPVNKLTKGVYYHLDIAVISLINLAMSLLGLPWIHGALPQSPMHARALADVVLDVDPNSGHVFSRVIQARETRLPILIAHVFIALSMFLLPSPLKFLPVPVLYGLFLYMAAVGLNGNGFWARFQLLFMEKSNYPSTTVVQKVARHVIHRFTVVQLLCLGILCAIGFAPNPYVQMTFPVLLVLLIVVRHRVLENYFGDNLQYLDGHNEQVIMTDENAPLLDSTVTVGSTDV